MMIVPKYRSVSQRNTYERCPYSYKLSRIDKVWQKPAAWLSQGLGVHLAMEEWEKSNRTLGIEDLIEIYVSEYQRSVEEQAETTPNFEWWFNSGPYYGAADIERRWQIGQDQLRSLVQWSLDHPEEKIWRDPDGNLAVELEFFVELGGVMVKGFIDQIVETEEGLVVRDIKTGSKPGDTFQLATYAEAMKIMHGVDINRGDYFMGKTGKPTKPFVITDEDKAMVHAEFTSLDKKILSEEFPPKPSKSNCGFCSVKHSCKFMEY